MARLYGLNVVVHPLGCQIGCQLSAPRARIAETEESADRALAGGWWSANARE